MPARSEIRDLRLFVQLGPDAMSYKLPHHTEAVGFHKFLNRRAHVADRIADPHLLDAFVQRRFRDFQQLAQLRLTESPTGTVIAASP